MEWTPGACSKPNLYPRNLRNLGSNIDELKHDILGIFWGWSSERSPNLSSVVIFIVLACQTHQLTTWDLCMDELSH